MSNRDDIGSSGIGIEDGEDVFVAGEEGEVNQLEMVGGAARGGEVAEVVGELPGENTIEFAFD